MIKRLFFLLFFCACIPSTDYSHIKIVKVIDGDTVILANGQHLRYIGIDTPETHIKQGNTFVYQPQPFSEEATKFNRELVENKFVRIEFDVEPKDRYNRLLGYCFVDQTLVNAQIVKEGFAVLYTSPPNVRYADTFVAAQKEARRNKKGLWGAYEIIGPNDAARYINQIRTVRGRVTKVFRSKKLIALDMGSGSKRDFSVILFRNNADDLGSFGADSFTRYKDKIVEVSGKIRNYKDRPEIVVHAPSEIQIVEETNPDNDFNR